MTNLDHLFSFPIVMIDGDNEEKKSEDSMKLGLSIDDEDVDIIIGQSECPYYDFISVTDRWLPTEESFQNALNRKFDACGVLFANSGTFICPWPREKFKKELKKFIDKQPKEDDEIKVMTLTKSEAEGFLKKLTTGDD